ncbi:Acetoin utilization deacetylase AcuC [Lysobacter sp. yr284]|uniref:histone deacetylase family protein n=1 Tax=Lysobacter TaxID=68 RepID=UPI0008984354|nr:histone deacetylase family protein [Lysobacter sp. yr284]SDZ04569.1 Acetoin utilization deacetylase AcuC [Lysobacter sp. yr284]
MRVYTHPACTRHDPGPGHAERPLRLVAVTESLREAFAERLHWHEAPAASRGQLLRAHSDELLALVLDTPVDGPVQLDPDTVLAPGSAEAALRAAGAGVAAVDCVLKGEDRRVFCAVRPPGHHATVHAAMGFCLFNNIAVAAAHACDKHGLARVAVIDFDVHHGNGTQAIFDSDPRVLYVSSHQLPLYPDTGYAHERGVGNIVNAPLPAGTGSAGFRRVWRERLLPIVDGFRPQLVLISAGFDAHKRDPLAQIELDGEDFAWLTAELVAIAERHAAGRVVSMLEGGYDLAALRESAVAHVGAMLA